MLISHQQVHLSTVGTSKGRCNCKAVPGSTQLALRPTTKPLSIAEASEYSASWSMKAKNFIERLCQMQPQQHFFKTGKKTPEQVCVQGMALSSTSSPPHANTPYAIMETAAPHRHYKATSNLCDSIPRRMAHSSTAAICIAERHQQSAGKLTKT